MSQAFCAGCKGRGLTQPCLFQELTHEHPDFACVRCVAEAKKEGRFIGLCGTLRQKCEKHPRYYLWHAKEHKS